MYTYTDFTHPHSTNKTCSQCGLALSSDGVVVSVVIVDADMLRVVVVVIVVRKIRC